MAASMTAAPVRILRRVSIFFFFASTAFLSRLFRMRRSFLGFSIPLLQFLQLPLFFLKALFLSHPYDCTSDLF